MELYIIYPVNSTEVAVIIPSPNSGLTIEQIAEKDVPNGLPWRIVSSDNLPLFESSDRWEWTDDGPLIVRPEVIPVPQEISFAQMLIGLVSENWLTEAEGEAWLEGTLPAPVIALIGQLPANQRFAARARAIRPSSVLRTDPLVLGLAELQGKTSQEMDNFFITYSVI